MSLPAGAQASGQFTGDPVTRSHVVRECMHHEHAMQYTDTGFSGHSNN